MIEAAKFISPAKPYREVPFWSWNEDLDPTELRRQIGLMDEAGWGGFFMHSRVGLQTPYLGERWMECVRACIAEAKTRGMDAWLYDEDKWPSGFGGGLAVVDPAHRAQALVCLVDNKPALLVDRVAAFMARSGAGGPAGFQPLADPGAFVTGEDTLVQFYVLNNPLGVTWLKGYTYFNPLNPAAVRAFLDSTHEVYARACGDEFGRAIPGIFTDEPAYLNASIPDIGVTAPGQLQAIPWVDDLPEAFRGRWGYDLLPNLPALFFDTGAYPQVRYHFWRLITERFVEAFSKQVGDWCEEHHLQLTGHYLLEDQLWVQTRWIGAAMPHYEYQQLPGIDKLARTLFTPLTVKQLDSAACQLGKARALCESYGVAGQELSLAGRKWIGDWLYVLGINLNNPHLSLYSMRGERKRDCPPNLYYQQPWWPENRLVADYYARLSYLLSQGQRVVDILVLHPMGSAWSRYRPDAMGEVGKLDEALVGLEKVLLGAQRDFHYGDELLLQKYARVVPEPGEPRFEVGKMSYRVVIVPPSFTWSASTVQLLADFAAAGGTILAVPPLPGEVEGRADGRVLPETTRSVLPAGLPAELDRVLPFDVRIPDSPEVWVHHRREGETDCYFLANTSLEKGCKASIDLRGGGRLETWDAVNGTVTPVPAQQARAAGGIVTRFALDLAPAGSLVLVRHRELPPLEPVPHKDQSERSREFRLLLPDAWTLAGIEANALTLDSAAVKIGEGDWSSPMYILDAHQRVKAQGSGTPFSLRYTVDVDQAPPGPLYLVVETPEKYTFTVNGQPLASQDLGWWRDISFRRLDLRGCLGRGMNELVLSGVFQNDMELESVYLLGEFGVSLKGGLREGELAGQTFYRYRPPFRVKGLPQEFHSGDLVKQGLPFFAGRIRLAQRVQITRQPACARLEFGGLKAALARVYLNGQDLGVTAWPPYAVDLGDALRPGDNLLEVELANTLRNLLGPHHLSGGDPEGVGPESYRRNPDWTDDYVLVPFGFNRTRLILNL